MRAVRESGDPVVSTLGGEPNFLPFLIPRKFSKFSKFDPGLQASGVFANDSCTLRSSEISSDPDHSERPVITHILALFPPERSDPPEAKPAPPEPKATPPERSGTP